MPERHQQSNSQKPAAEQEETTRLESEDEVRRAIQARHARRSSGKQMPEPEVPETVPVGVEVRAERPVIRPAMALLCILDDGKAEGEWVRLRNEVTVIGRTDGDIRIPHDGSISGRHAQLVRQRVGGGYRWVLSDLQSSNGTFVRMGKTLLRHEDEIIIGAGRYRFEEGAKSVNEGAGSKGNTQSWGGTPVNAFVPSLVEIAPAGAAGRVSLTLPEYWIGRDIQTCTIARPDDLLVSERHGRLYRDSERKWHLENNKSINGIWLCIREPLPIGGGCQFRMGEQRFLFRSL
jgi:pSer/pThr/pTyr-binding forkhead associated (FHA) protein